MYTLEGLPPLLVVIENGLELLRLSNELITFLDRHKKLMMSQNINFGKMKSFIQPSRLIRK